MAHNITGNDSFGSTKSEWHGIGERLPEGLTATAALNRLGLDTKVTEQTLLRRADDGTIIEVESHKAIIGHTGEQFAIVGKNYTPIQNTELAELADALPEGTDQIRVETMGTILGGRRIFIGIAGNSFSVRGHDSDEIKPYILLTNGHDGLNALRALNTSVRVVCNNTLNMALSAGKKSGYTFKHCPGIKTKVDEIKAALSLYNRSMEATRKEIDTLAGADVNSDKVNEFLLKCYQNEFGGIPTNPTTAKEHKSIEQAQEAIRICHARFDKEKAVSGANMWTAFNAFSGLVQHEWNGSRSYGTEKQFTRYEGKPADQTTEAFKLALSMV